MQVELIAKEKDSMELKLIGESETFLIPLKNQLLEDSAVAYANYNVRHPKLDVPPFYFKVNSGKPQNALKKACKALSNTFKDIQDQFEKQS
jgi:DNA-directed RNA polymerase subunit L